MHLNNSCLYFNYMENQLFRQNYERVLIDTYNKKIENGKRLIPEEFYSVNGLVTVLFMLKVILIIMMLRYSSDKKTGMVTNIMIGIIGISILNFYDVVNDAYYCYILCYGWLEYMNL